MNDISELYPMLERVAIEVSRFLNLNWNGTIEEALITYYDFSCIIMFMETYNTNYQYVFGLPIFGISLAYLLPLHRETSHKLTDVLTKRLGDKDFEYISRMSVAIYN